MHERVPSGSARYLYLLLVVLVAAAISAASWAIWRSGNGRLAASFVATCTKEADRAACYEREIPKLYPERSVSEIFDIVREVRKEDPKYQFCHVLAHKIGQRVVAEDPDKWLDAIPLNPSDGLCSNGFIHGVVGGRFRSEVLDDATLEKFIPQFARACEPRGNWDPSSLDRAICYHGLGHLYDFITNANIPKALDICKRTTSDAYRRVCIEGVFMQIYQPLEPDDYVMIDLMPVKPTKTTVRTYCASFKSPDFVGACLRESWPFFREEIIDKGGAGAFCSGQPNAEQENQCYESISSIVGRMTLGDPDRTAKTCDTFPAARRSVCYGTSAEAVLEENRTEASRAVALCERAPARIKSACINLLINRAQFVFGDDARMHEQFCASVPEEDRERCIAER